MNQYHQHISKVDFESFAQKYSQLMDIFLYPQGNWRKKNNYTTDDLKNIEIQITGIKINIEKLIQSDSKAGLSRLKNILTELIKNDFSTYLEVYIELKKCLERGIDRHDEHFWIIEQAQSDMYGLIRDLFNLFAMYYPDDFEKYSFLKSDQTEIEVLNNVSHKRRGTRFNIEKLIELYKLEPEKFGRDKKQLASMFENYGDLVKVDDLLKKHGFLKGGKFYPKSGVLKAPGEIAQFVALVKVCEPLLRRGVQKQVYRKAFISYYKHPSFDLTSFKPSKKPLVEYKSLFSFLKKEFPSINNQWDSI